MCVCVALSSVGCRLLELLVVNKRLQQPTRSLSLAAVAHFLIHVCMSEPSQTSQTSQNSDGWCRGPDATVLPPIRRQSGDVVVHPSLRSMLVTAVSQERPAADFFKCGTWCWWSEVKGHYALTKHKSRCKIWQFHTSILDGCKLLHDCKALIRDYWWRKLRMSLFLAKDIFTRVS